MRSSVAGAIGGLAAGAVLSAVMILGRRAGLLREMLAERSEAWLNEKFETGRRFGSRGTTALEQANHAAASTGFGVAYGMARPYFPALNPLAGGAIFGASLYAVNIAGIAPLIGITRGEWREPTPVVLQRLGLHLLYGVTTAVITATLTKPKTDGSSSFPRTGSE